MAINYYRAADWRNIARYRAHDGNLPVGYLEIWTYGQPKIGEVSVRPSHRRQGIATAMLGLAKRDFPNLRHSTDRTKLGDLWAHSTGDEIPLYQGELWPEELHERFDDSWDQWYWGTYSVPVSSMTRLDIE